MPPSTVPVRHPRRAGRLVQVYLDPTMVEELHQVADESMRTFKAELTLAIQAYLRAKKRQPGQPPSPEDASEGE